MAHALCTCGPLLVLFSVVVCGAAACGDGESEAPAPEEAGVGDGGVASDATPSPGADADAGASTDADASGADAPQSATLSIDAIGPIAVTQGATAQVAVTVHRSRVGGAVHLEAKSPPSGLTIAAIDLAAGVSAGTFDVSASASATTKTFDVDIAATATDDDGTAVEASTKMTVSITGTAGSVDATFGSAGRVSTSDRVLSVAVQPDGKILALGATWLARFEADGAVDAAFGTAGKLAMPAKHTANALALQPDGKIAIAGRTSATGYPIFAARVTSAGAFDATFGAGGIATTELGGNDSSSDVVVDAAMRIVQTGFSGGVNSPLELVRYTTTGGLDGTFGTGGIASSSGYAAANAVAIQKDGKLVVTGSTGFGYTTHAVALARFGTNGAADATFVPAAATAGSGNFVVVTDDDKILVVGVTQAANSGTDYADIQLVRYESTGAFDTGFGTAGVVKRDIAGGLDFGLAAAVLPNGSIVVSGGGSSVANSGTADRCVLARYASNGDGDTTFGANGVAMITGARPSNDLAVQGDGKIVMGCDASVVRFWP